MKKRTAVILTAFMTCAMAIAPMTAMAAAPGSEGTVSQGASSSEAQSEVTLDKTEEIMPSFTVSVPATITLGRQQATLKYSMNLENHDNFIPDGKKVSVKITSAGYPTEYNKFAVWDSHNLREATYKITQSSSYENPHVYQIGEEVASWTGSDWGTQLLYASVDNYDSVAPGSYTGFINYSISLENAE